MGKYGVSSWIGVALLSLVVSSVSAQGIYSLGDAAHLETGCGEPSPCDCLVSVVGPLGGTLELRRMGSSGSFDWFEISNVDWVLGSMGPLPVITDITGSGIYRIDALAGVHEIELDLVVGGVPQVFASLGAVPGGDPSLDGIVISAYRQLMPGGCEFDGIHLIAGVTSRFFKRGDCTADGSRNIADPIFLLDLLFGPTDPLPNCEDACDANDDGQVNLADAIAMLTALFGGGLLPPPGMCGVDPTDDNLTCDHYFGC